MKVRLVSQAAFLGLAVALLAGCGGGKDTKGGVTGKVMLDGKPVSGEVIFTCSDGKDLRSPIGADGHYTIVGPPKGDAKIAVKSLVIGGSGPTTGPKVDTANMPSAGAAGVPAPAKYGNSATSGLTYNVKGGDEKYDITLTP